MKANSMDPRFARCSRPPCSDMPRSSQPPNPLPPRACDSLKRLHTGKVENCEPVSRQKSWKFLSGKDVWSA